jgi:hypothetical protein
MKRLTLCFAAAAALVGFASSADAELRLFRFLDRDERSDSRRDRERRDAERREAAFPGRAWERDRAGRIVLIQGPQLVPQVDGAFHDPLVQIPPAPLDERGLPPVPESYFGEPLPPAALPQHSIVPEQLPLLPKMAGPHASGPIELYRRVKYDDRDDAHPRGVKQLVAVRDPRACRKVCDCCGPRLVFVEVCVPPHGCPKIKVSKDAGKVELDYGEYEIEIEVEDDEIEVEYED